MATTTRGLVVCGVLALAGAGCRPASVAGAWHARYTQAGFSWNETLTFTGAQASGAVTSTNVGTGNTAAPGCAWTYTMTGTYTTAGSSLALHFDSGSNALEGCSDATAGFALRPLAEAELASNNADYGGHFAIGWRNLTYTRGNSRITYAR